MTTQEAGDAVLAFLQKNAGSTKQAITEAIGIKGLALTNAMKKLTKDGLITSEGEADETTYTAGEPVSEQTQVETLDEEETTPSKGRDVSTLKFMGQDLKKGPCVREVVKQFVEDQIPTLKQLKEAFPDELLKRFGVWQEEDTAKSIQGARDRYFWKEEHQIKVKGKVIVVCNQWTSENIKPFLKRARELGYKIK
jgi:predicted transcriptional regulator